MMGLPVVLRSFDELAHSVRTGRPSIELSDPDGLWGYLRGRLRNARSSAEP